MGDVLSSDEIQSLILHLVKTRTAQGRGASEEEIEQFVAECEKLRVHATLLAMLLGGEIAGDLVRGELVFANV